MMIEQAKLSTNYEICFNADGDWKVKIHTDTGRVEFAEGVDIDAASELFWTLLAGESPKALLAEIEELQNKLYEYEKEEARVTDFDLAMISLVSDPEEGCEISQTYDPTSLLEDYIFGDRIEDTDYERAMKVVE